MSLRTIPAGRQTSAQRTLYGVPIRTSTLVPRDAIIVLNGRPSRPDKIDLLMPSGRHLLINPAATDRYGSTPWVLRAIDPRPGFTRHSLGQRELERDRRRRNRRPRL